MGIRFARSTMSKPATTPKPTPLPSSTRMGSLMTRKIALDFVLPGFLAGTVGALVSPGGVGKSYWSLQLALDIAGLVKGASLTGLNASRGRIVLLSAEDPEDVLGTRLQAIAGAAKGRVAFPERDSDRPLLDHRNCVGLGVDVMDESWFSQLCEVGKDARLIVLDTLRRFHQLDENSTQDMTRVLAQLERLAKETGASVLYLHHTSKAAVLNGQATLQQAARGASVLVDNARWVSYLAVMTEVEARQFGIPVGTHERYVRWNISKQNYGPAQEDRWYQRDDGGVLLPVSLPTQASRSTGAAAPEPMLTHGHPGAAAPKGFEGAGPHAAEGVLMATGATPVAEHGAQVSVTLPESAPAAPTMSAVPKAKPIPSANNAFGGNW